MSDPISITALLGRWRDGDREAEAALARAIYPVLHQAARANLRKHDRGLTLGATDLAHEAYLRLREQHDVDWQNRNHFFAIAATIVRRVVIDYLRERHAEKRGGNKILVDVAEAEQQEIIGSGDRALDWVALDAALERLAQLDPECAKVVDMKLFTPMTADEIAEACGSSVATVGRHWRFARHWLARELEDTNIQNAE